MGPSKAAIIGVTAIAVALFLTSTVFAGPTEKSWLEVLVMNKPDSPIPVDVMGAVDVENEVKINDSTPINVKVQEPLEVEGTIDLEGKIDVSGWLHTTESGKWSDTMPKNQYSSISIVTDGYRQATIIIVPETDGLCYYITYRVGDTDFPGGMFVLDPIPWSGIYEVLPVISEEIIVHISNQGNEDIDFEVTWYLTT